MHQLRIYLIHRNNLAEEASPYSDGYISFMVLPNFKFMFYEIYGFVVLKYEKIMLFISLSEEMVCMWIKSDLTDNIHPCLAVNTINVYDV